MSLMRKSNILRGVFSVLICFSVAACDGGFGGRLDPVIETPLGPNYDALATGAERRIVVSGTVVDVVERHVPTAKGTYALRKIERERNVVCAEPSPDAIEALAARVQANTSAVAQRSEAEKAQINAELNRQIASNASSVLRRSQGLALFRDGVFALCQARLNGLQDENAYTEAFKQLLHVSADLISKEFGTQGWNSATQVTVVSPVVSDTK